MKKQSHKSMNLHMPAGQRRGLNVKKVIFFEHHTCFKYMDGRGSDSLILPRNRRRWAQAAGLANMPVEQTFDARILKATAKLAHARIMKIVNAEPAALPDSCREEVRDAAWLPRRASRVRFAKPLSSSRNPGILISLLGAGRGRRHAIGLCGTRRAG